MKFPKEYLEEIKQRIKVSDIVGSSVQLKRRGREFVGLSPFSKEVFSAYFKALDPEKNTFLQSDIDGLSNYSTTIDDEIHGATIAFQPAVSRIYEIRINNVRFY